MGTSSSEPIENCLLGLQKLSDVSYFYDAVSKRPDLVSHLVHDSQLTLFAPTNDAFAAIPVDSYTKEYFDHLLEYHIVVGKRLDFDDLSEYGEDAPNYCPSAEQGSYPAVFTLSCPLNTLYSGHNLDVDLYGQ